MKQFSILVVLLLFFSVRGTQVQAQTASLIDDHTAREETEGKVIWEKLQSKQLECKNLTDENYEVLGEYFMGQSIGDTQRHALMNQMMTNMMGEEGEEQMHVTMGKRLSGCEPNAQVPSNVVGFIRYLGGSTRNSDRERSPLDILKERYAKGDIDKKEFEQMKKDLA